VFIEAKQNENEKKRAREKIMYDHHDSYVSIETT